VGNGQTQRGEDKGEGDNYIADCRLLIGKTKKINNKQ